MFDKCEHTGPQGRCTQSPVDGSVYCKRHCKEADRIKGYRLSSPDLKQRFDHHADSLLESVRQEIILLRALIEDRLSLAKTEADRINAFNTVRPAIVDVVKCVETLQKLERQNNIVLSKEAIMKLRKDIVDILVSELEHLPNYESIVDGVARKLAAAIAGAKNEP